METDCSTLINKLIAITHSNIEKAEAFKQLDLEILNNKTVASAWSILECIEHLNRYDSFYLPYIQNYTSTAASQKTEVFKSGLIGNYLVKAVIPRKSSKKMKTFKSMDPVGSNLSISVIETFLAGQQILLKQLEQAKKLNLNSRCISVTFTKLVKLRLGDALSFMVFHNQRHVLQAERNIRQ